MAVFVAAKVLWQMEHSWVLLEVEEVDGLVLLVVVVGLMEDLRWLALWPPMAW